MISIWAITGSVFAHDCALVLDNNSESILNNYTINYTKYQNFLPVEAFNQALIHLKAYCCSQVTSKSCSQKEKENLPKIYPESAYLFDQILDVMMRRLDGNKELAYGLEPDPTGSARRQNITEIANNTSGLTPKHIETLYTEYRTLHANTTKFTDIVLNNYQKNNLATLSLLDKYTTLCSLTKDIYTKMQKDQTIVIWWYADKNSFFSKCENMVNDRVKRENGYVKILMVQKSNQLFDESMKAYTKKHFVEEKLMGLWNLVAKVKDIFKTIVQQAPVSKSCSK